MIEKNLLREEKLKESVTYLKAPKRDYKKEAMVDGDENNDKLL